MIVRELVDGRPVERLISWRCNQCGKVYRTIKGMHRHIEGSPSCWSWLVQMERLA